RLLLFIVLIGPARLEWWAPSAPGAAGLRVRLPSGWLTLRWTARLPGSARGDIGIALTFLLKLRWSRIRASRLKNSPLHRRWGRRRDNGVLLLTQRSRAL